MKHPALWGLAIEEKPIGMLAAPHLKKVVRLSIVSIPEFLDHGEFTAAPS
jgi:hypothetical protein